MTFLSQLNTIRILLGFVSIQLLSGFPNVSNNNREISSTDSLLSKLATIEEQSLVIRKSILDAIDENIVNDEVEMLIHIYDINKRSNTIMNQLLTQTLGNIGDKKVIPILMKVVIGEKS